MFEFKGKSATLHLSEKNRESYNAQTTEFIDRSGKKPKSFRELFEGLLEFSNAIPTQAQSPETTEPTAQTPTDFPTISSENLQRIQNVLNLDDAQTEVDIDQQIVLLLENLQNATQNANSLQEQNAKLQLTVQELENEKENSQEVQHGILLSDSTNAWLKKYMEDKNISDESEIDEVIELAIEEACTFLTHSEAIQERKKEVENNEVLIALTVNEFAVLDAIKQNRYRKGRESELIATESLIKKMIFNDNVILDLGGEFYTGFNQRSIQRLLEENH